MIKIDNEMIKVFENKEFGNVRAMIINDKPYFIGNDIAEILRYKRPSKAIRKYIDEDDRVKYFIKGIIGRNKEMWVINENGLYSLIVNSKNITRKQKENIISFFKENSLLNDYSINVRKEMNNYE